MKLHEDYSDQGLVIIGVHADTDTDKAIAVATQFDHRWASAADTNKTLFRAYGCSGWPTKFLVGVDGKVLWKGNFVTAETTRMIVAELAKVDPSAMGRPGAPPESEPVLTSEEDLPRALRSVHKSLEDERFSAAIKKAEKIREGRRSSEEEIAAAESLLDYVQNLASWRWAGIRQLVRDDDPYLASERFKHFEKDFKALPNFVTAIEELDESFKVRATRDAISTGRKFYKLLEDLEADKNGVADKIAAFAEDNPDSAYTPRLLEALRESLESAEGDDDGEGGVEFMGEDSDDD